MEVELEPEPVVMAGGRLGLAVVEGDWEREWEREWDGVWVWAWEGLVVGKGWEGEEVLMGRDFRLPRVVGLVVVVVTVDRERECDNGGK